MKRGVFWTTQLFLIVCSSVSKSEDCKGRWHKCEKNSECCQVSETGDGRKLYTYCRAEDAYCIIKDGYCKDAPGTCIYSLSPKRADWIDRDGCKMENVPCTSGDECCKEMICHKRSAGDLCRFRNGENWNTVYSKFHQTGYFSQFYLQGPLTYHGKVKYPNGTFGFN